MRKVKILGNLEPEMRKLGFDKENCKHFREKWALCNTECEGITWVDKETNQEYLTVDLGIEIPIQCVEFLD